MRSLLDVNVVIALIDFDHLFHARAHAWWDGAKHDGWSSCPLTENGVVRIMSRPGYGAPESYTPGDVLGWLTEFLSNTDHEFWPDALSLTDPKFFDSDKILGPKQITDQYLLALAASRDGVFVTFDQSINTTAVRNALPGHLLVI